MVRGYLACVCLDSFQDIDTNTVSGQISGGVINSAQQCTYVQHSNRFYNVKLFFDFLRSSSVVEYLTGSSNGTQLFHDMTFGIDYTTPIVILKYS